MAMNIIYERGIGNLNNWDSSGTHAVVMFARLELLCTLFLDPLVSTDGCNVGIDPVAPVLPEAFSDLRQARHLFFAICRYRHSRLSRKEPWTNLNPHFLYVRELFLRWDDLILTYRAGLSSEDKVEFQRASAMSFQSNALFPAYMYSVRTDLHSLRQQTRPKQVQISEPDRVSMLIEFPTRYVELIRGMDNWNPDRGEDPLGLGLWPSAELLSSSPERFVVKVGFY